MHSALPPSCTSSTPFTLDGALAFDPLWAHLVGLVNTTDPNTLVFTSKECLPDLVLESTSNIALVLNLALRRFYPLQQAHREAIQNYIQHVFAWFDLTASSLDLLGSDNPRLNLRPMTPPQHQAQIASVNLSPTRQQALSLAQSAKSINPALWSKLCRIIQQARDLHAEVKQNIDPELSAFDHELLNNRINEFLSIVKSTRPRFEHLFLNLTNASLEPEDSGSAVLEALDRLINSADECTQDEAVTYLILRLPASHSRPDRSDDNQDLELYFAQQLRRDYRGDAPARFLRFVHNVHKHFTKSHQAELAFDAYLQGTSIVQSSGTGKTRLVLELGKKAPLLYVCVRRKELGQRSSVKNGFPLAEENLYEYFRNATSNTKASCDLQVAAFLGAWFETLCSRLEACATARQKYEYLAQLNDYGGSGIGQRKPFFDDVLTSANTKLAAATAPGALTGNTNVFARFLDHVVCLLGPQLELVQEWLWNQHQSDYQALGIDRPPVFVAFDECVELIVSRPGGDPHDHQLNSLRRAWHHLLELQNKPNKPAVTFWLVLLSTNTSAAKLVEPQNLQGSARARDKQPLPVFVGLGFDVLRGEQPALGSPRDVFGMRHIRSYGRPLWDSLPSSTFWDVAVFKLLGAKPFNPSNAVLCYNVLASRLSLQFIPTHRGDSALFGEQKSLVTQSVDRHMRILQQVIDHTSLAISAPSEPVLAIAAALIMLTNASQDSDSTAHPSTNYAKVIDTFTTQSLPKLGADFLRGPHGEFMARFAMMAASDAVKLASLQEEWHKQKDGQPNEQQDQRQDEQRDSASIVSEAVQLQDFLGQLATLDEQGTSVVTNAIYDVCNKVQRRLSDHSPSSPGTGGKDVVGAWLNFTHFDALPKGISCISPDYLWYCWKRGVALQMAHGQSGVDGIIPVFVGKLSQKFRAPGGDNQPGSSDTDVNMAADEAKEIDEGQAARQMTYIAWEAKYKDEAMGDADARRPSRAGPTLLPAACDTNIDTNRPEIAPLTHAGLVTVIADLGTKQAFAASKSLEPQAEIVTSVGGKSSFLRLWIRGMADPRAYPCFDALGVRPNMMALFQTVTLSPAYEEDNKIPSAVWNSRAHPESRSCVVEGPLQSLHWSPSRPPTAEDDDALGEPMQV